MFSERGAGLLYVEDCVRAHLDAARSLGATIHQDEAVTAWQSDGRSAFVTTTKGSTGRAAWSSRRARAGRLLANLGAPLRVMRQTMLWFGQPMTGPTGGRFPIFLAEVSGGPFYGLPVIDGRGLKVALFRGPGASVPGGGRAGDPAGRRAARAGGSSTPTCPASTARSGTGATCIYTLTPDRHFLIDLHPQYPNVAVAGGFSGHGFKFAAVVGEILADLVESGRTRWPIGMFAFGRLPRA